MRLLSQMTTDETCDVLCIAAPCIQNMADDKKLVSELSRTLPKDEHSQMGVYRFWISRIAVLVPIVLKDHRTDFYGILCAFNGLSEVECGAQPLMQTLAQVKELCNDKDFVDFFVTLFGMGRKA